MSRKSIVETFESRSFIYTMLTKIVYGRFEWSNLPYGLTSRQLERFITNWSASTHAAGTYNDKYGPIILPAVNADMRNLYYLSNRQNLQGSENTFTVDTEKCALFYDNSSYNNLYSVISETEKRLSDIWVTMKLNTNQKRNPWAFSGNEDEIQSIRASVAKTEENQGYIFLTRETADLLKNNSQPFFPTNVEYICPQMMEQYQQVFNNFLTLIGVNNVPVMKKERLITDEAQSNNQLVIFNRDDCIRRREEAAQEFYNLTGVLLDVKWKGGNDIVSAVDDGSTI